METVYIIGVLMIIAVIEIIPLYFISKYESKNKKNFYKFHLLANVIFIVWSIYDISYGYHYPHGPNVLLLIIPAWPALMIFYGFIYRKMITDKNARILAYVLSGVYLVGSVLGAVAMWYSA